MNTHKLVNTQINVNLSKNKMWRVKLFSSAFQNLTFLPISFFKKKISSSTQDYRWAHNQIQPMKHCQSPKRIQTFKKKWVCAREWHCFQRGREFT